MWATLSGPQAKEQLTTCEDMAGSRIPDAQERLGKASFALPSFPKTCLWKPRRGNLDLTTLGPPAMTGGAYHGALRLSANILEAPRSFSLTREP